MAYDESTAWFHVQHCLKPLRLLLKKIWREKLGNLCNHYYQNEICQAKSRTKNHQYSRLQNWWHL